MQQGTTTGEARPDPMLASPGTDMIVEPALAFSAAPPAPPPFEGPLVTWRRIDGLIGLSLVNFLLNVVTIGFYQFWAKADVRRRIWASVRVAGEPLSYSGTGRELLTGFLLAFAVVILPGVLLPIAVFALFGNDASGLVQAILYGVLTFLFGVAVWRAQRYRLNRTAWRGIGFDLEGSALRYGWTSFWTLLLVPLTLGLVIPWRSVRLQSILINGMRFGNAKFAFDGSSRPLYLRFLVLWLATIALVLIGLAALGGIAVQRISPTPGGLLTGILLLLGVIFAYSLMSSWYRSFQFNYFASRTTLGHARFKGTMTGGGLFWLTLTNYFLSLASLGILMPLVQARSARYIVRSLEISGAADIAGVAQIDAAKARGEGLAYALNFDAF